MQDFSIVPKHQVLDNKIYKAYKEEILATGITFQLALPDNHCRNIAEKSIHTWKDHFIGVMSGTVTKFLLDLWFQAITQAERQILLLSQSNVNPAISAYAYVYGPHEYNSEPFVPIVMENLVHNNPRLKKTFAEHCSKGNVLRTSFEHYCAWIMWMKEK